MASPSDSKPIIVGFLCNWCCYAGADLAGVSRFQYASNLRVIRQMCSGRVDLEFILQAFIKQADGVFVGGCHPGDCHYNPEGNYDALGNSLIAKRILESIGIRPERLRLEWVSAGEGTRFAEIQNEFSATIEGLGHLGTAENKPFEELQAGLQAAIDLVPYIKLVERERFRLPQRTEENYHELHDDPKFHALFEELILDKLSMGRIMGYARLYDEATVADIAANLDLPVTDVLRHLDVLTQRGMAKVDTQRVRVLAPA